MNYYRTKHPNSKANLSCQIKNNTSLGPDDKSHENSDFQTSTVSTKLQTEELLENSNNIES